MQEELIVKLLSTACRVSLNGMSASITQEQLAKNSN